jgi:hypothetical protein
MSATPLDRHPETPGEAPRNPLGDADAVGNSEPDASTRHGFDETQNP